METGTDSCCGEPHETLSIGATQVVHACFDRLLVVAEKLDEWGATECLDAMQALINAARDAVDGDRVDSMESAAADAMSPADLLALAASVEHARGDGPERRCVPVRHPGDGLLRKPDGTPVTIDDMDRARIDRWTR